MEEPCERINEKKAEVCFGMFDSRRLNFGYRETFEKMLKECKRGAFSDAAPDGFGGGFGFGFGGYLCC